VNLEVPDGVDASEFELLPGVASDFGASSVLCLHGLSGTPYEVRPVAERLALRGFRCRGPVMAGHERSARELAGTSHEAWLEVARAEIEVLRRDSDRVFVVGLSMGGLVSLELAAAGLVDGVAVIGTPLRFSLALRWGVPFVKFVYPYLSKKNGSDIQEDEARARHPGFRAIPLASVHQLIRLQRRVERSLAGISVPILAAHGALDRTANPRDAKEILAEVNSLERELHICERSGHVATVDHDGAELSLRVAEFFERLL
jgi:carboxylesterase